MDVRTCMELGILCFSMAGFIHMCYRLLPGNLHSVVWFLIICVVMVLCAGILLPLSYLPKWIQPAGSILPFHVWQQFMGGSLFSECTVSEMGIVLGYTALEMGIGALALWKKS